jgi:predicted NACHT family NTPase
MSNEGGIEKKLVKVMVDGPVKQSVNSVFDSINRNVESLDLFSKYERIQKKQIRTQLENIKLLGMSSPIPLASIYYPARISTTIRRRLYEQEWTSERGPNTTINAGSQHHKKKEHFSAVEYIGNHPKVVVLGGPGAGKTTLLRFLALVHAEAIPKEKPREDALPFFVHLPQLAKSGKELFTYLCDIFVKASDQYAVDFLKRLLIKGNCIILLDSLDEVPSSMRNDLISLLSG